MNALDSFFLFLFLASILCVYKKEDIRKISYVFFLIESINYRRVVNRNLGNRFCIFISNEN